MAHEKVTFPGAHGTDLAARLDLPDSGPPSAYALFAHCFTCGKDIAAAARIARGLTARHWGVLRFDFTGLGHSEGEFASTNFSSNVQDLIAAAGYLTMTRAAPVLMVGHSLGGAAVLAAAGEIPGCRAVATIGAPSDPAHVSHMFAHALDSIETDGEATVSLAGRAFTIRQQFLDDIRVQPQRDRISRLKRALMVMHSPTDTVVGIDNAAEIYAAAKHPKSFVSLDGADHMLTDAGDAEFVANMLAIWAGRYAAG